MPFLPPNQQSQSTEGRYACKFTAKVNILTVGLECFVGHHDYRYIYFVIRWTIINELCIIFKHLIFKNAKFENVIFIWWVRNKNPISIVFLILWSCQNVSSYHSWQRFTCNFYTRATCEHFIESLQQQRASTIFAVHDSIEVILWNSKLSLIHELQSSCNRKINYRLQEIWLSITNRT